MEEIKARPLSVTILSVFVLCITSWNAIRVYGALANWEILREFGASPVYIMLSGLGWIAASLWLTRELWEPGAQAFRAGLGLSGLYVAWYWIDRLAIQPTPAPNVAFSAVVSVVLLAYVIINLLAAKPFFNKEKDEREHENQGTT